MESQYSFDILGQKIVIKDQEEANLAEMALKIVDEKVKEIQKDRPLLGPQQIAVLALLEVAGSLIKDRKAIDDYRLELDRRCTTLMTEISKINPVERAEKPRFAV